MKLDDGTWTGNPMHGVRLPLEIVKKLKEGMEITGFNKSQFIRQAITEKAEREIINKEQRGC